MEEDLRSLADAALRGYGLELTEIESVEGGADAYARAFRAIDGTGNRLFLKTRPSIDAGMILCTALRDAGIREVLAPVKTLGGEPAFPIDGGFLLVYPWIEGWNGFQRLPGLEQWEQVGKALRLIHDVRLHSNVLRRLATEAFVVSGVDEFRFLMGRLLAGGARDEVEESLGETIRVHKEKIDRTIIETEELGDRCRRGTWDLVACHTDIHMANILVDTAGGVHLVDWDAPRLAPRECDLMFFMDGGILGKHGMDEEAAFFQGYGDYSPDADLVSYYKHERALSDFASYAHEASAEIFAAGQRKEALEQFKRLCA